MITKIKFQTKDHKSKEICFYVIKIIKTSTFSDRYDSRRTQEEVTHSVFIGETSSSKEELIKLVEERQIEITDTSCRTHKGTFIYFKPVRNNEYEICFEISREVDNQFKAHGKDI